MTFPTTIIQGWNSARHLGKMFSSYIIPPEEMYAQATTGSQNGDSYCIPNVLKKITIIDSDNIDWRFLNKVKTLESVTLPASLKTVDGDCFAGCSSLSDVRMIGEVSDFEKISFEKGNEVLLDAAGKYCENMDFAMMQMLEEPENTRVYMEDKAVFYVFAAGKYPLQYHWQYTEDGGKTWKDDACKDYKIEIDYKTLEGREYRCIVTDEKGNSMPESSQNEPEKYAPGDLNGDGDIDVRDAVMLARFIAEDPDVRITTAGLDAADADGDGFITGCDTVMILQLITGKIKELPSAKG